MMKEILVFFGLQKEEVIEELKSTQVGNEINKREL